MTSIRTGAKIALGFLALAIPSISQGVVLNGIGNPAWDRTSEEGGHVAWEYFDVATGQGTFSNVAPDISLGGSTLTSSLSQTVAGVGTSGSGGENGDPARLLAGGAGSQFAFSIVASGSSTIDSMTIQIKHSNFLDEEFNEITSPFLVSLNGDTAISGVKNPNGTTSPESYRWAASDAGTSVFFWVYTYTWTGLDLAAGEDFTLNFQTPVDDLGFGLSVDTISLDVHYSVPEVGSSVLLGLSGMGMLLRRKRRC